jgi:hypothetical protein
MAKVESWAHFGMGHIGSVPASWSVVAGQNTYELTNGTNSLTFYGSFTYAADHTLSGGSIGLIIYDDDFQILFEASDFSLNVADVLPLVTSGNLGALDPFILQGDDSLEGHDASSLWGGAGNDTLQSFGPRYSGYAILDGGAGNDVLIPLTGDVVYGGDGFDRAILPVPFNSSTRVQVTAPDNLWINYQWALQGVERVEFSNGIGLAFDLNGDAGQAYRLYQAAFNRSPDIGGLSFWINSLDSGTSLTTVASSFIASAEFTNTYGVLDNAHFATQLYLNVLHRQPDAAGLFFWQDALDQGTMTRAEVLTGFSESAENRASVIGAIQNGIEYTI